MISGRTWIVATYKNEPAEKRRTKPVQMCCGVSKWYPLRRAYVRSENRGAAVENTARYPRTDYV